MSMERLIIRDAIPQDIKALTQILETVDLKTQDVLAPGTQFWLAHEKQGQMVGCAGMEFGETAVLLRNVAILPEFRKQGLGEELVEHALTYAQNQGYKAVYLFSVRSGGYWQRMGFREVTVDELVNALPESYQVWHFMRIGKLANEHAWRKDI
jgi:N-acetylglutamate synthase-like GNAT family acetyltransferase